MSDWSTELRSHFPLCSRRAYFFAGAQAPLAVEVRGGTEAFFELWEERAWRLEETEWRLWDLAADLLAESLGCQSSQVVAVESTSHAMGVATAMVLARWTRDGRSPANVVLHHGSHPASSYAWVNAARLGAPLELRWAFPAPNQSTVDAIGSAVDDETIAVVTTHVSHVTGERLDVARLASRFPERRFALLVDAAQSAGALRLERVLESCDFVGMPAYKWLLGPPGVGFLVIRPDWLEDIGPPLVGWASAREHLVMDAQNLALAAGAKAFRVGMPNFLAMAATVPALQILNAAGMARIADRIEHLTDRVLDGLERLGLSTPTPRSWDERAGVITVDLADAVAAMWRLLELDIEVGVEEGRLRIDPHAYNTDEEVDRLLEHLSAEPAACS